MITVDPAFSLAYEASEKLGISVDGVVFVFFAKRKRHSTSRDIVYSVIQKAYRSYRKDALARLKQIGILDGDSIGSIIRFLVDKDLVKKEPSDNFDDFKSAYRGPDDQGLFAKAKLEALLWRFAYLGLVVLFCASMLVVFTVTKNKLEAAPYWAVAYLTGALSFFRRK